LHIGRNTDARTKPVSNERVESGERHGTKIVPCRNMKLYRLGCRADIRVLTATSAQIARQRGERNKSSAPIHGRDIACGITRDDTSARIVSRHQARCRPSTVMEIYLLPTDQSDQIG
jgi:hypothetical protein